MYAANRLLNTGSAGLRTGQLTGTEALLGSGLAGVAAAGLVIAGIWFLWVKPRMDPGFIAGQALSGVEQRKLARLQAENMTLRDHINEVVCEVAAVGRQMSCPV